MKSKTNFIRRLWDEPAAVFTILVAISCIFTLVYLALLGNRDEVYTDVIMEGLSLYSSNKSIERALVYFLSFSGPFVYFFYFIKTRQGAKVRDVCMAEAPAEDLSSKVIVIILLVASGTCFVLYSQTYPLLTTGVLCALLVYAVDKSLVSLAFTALSLFTYAGLALYRLYVHLGGDRNLSLLFPVTAAFLLVALFLLFKKRKQLFIHSILISQCIVPALLLVLLAKNYRYQDTLYQIPPPEGYFCLSTF